MQNITCRIDISTATLNSVSHSISQQMIHRTQADLSPAVLDPLMRSIYSKERQRSALQMQKTIPGEEVTTVPTVPSLSSLEEHHESFPCD